MRRVVFEMLAGTRERLSLHMPGHKGRGAFGNVGLYELDTTELPNTDDLYSPEGALLEAQELYARAVGSGRTLFLHGGSTAGIHAMVQLYAGEGDTILLPRNAHLSAVNGCALGGVRAEWMPITQREDGLCYVSEEAVLHAMDRHPEAKAVLLTRPDYYGACLPLERIVAKAHALGMRVVVDEAHGAHFPWMKGIPSAGALGADAWVNSVHKTLMGLTGSAVLHLRSPEDGAKALRLLRREQTSSPSFLLMLSIDDSRAWMEAEGPTRLTRVIAAADALRSRLPSLGYRDAHELWRDTGLTFDPARLVIDAPQGGQALAEALAERGVDVEMYDLRRVVIILTAMDDEAVLDRLEAALQASPPKKAALPSLPDLSMSAIKRMDIRPAVMAACENVDFARAAGRVAAQSAGLYPPGVPLVCPGEVISEQTTRLLAQTPRNRRFGVEGDTLLCVKP